MYLHNFFQLETELHASQLQLQAIHTYPPTTTSTPSSYCNGTSQLTHLHTESAVVTTTCTTANPCALHVQTAAAPIGTTHSAPSSCRNLPMVSQPPAVITRRTPLSQLHVHVPTVGAHSNNTLPLPRAHCGAESMSSRATCTDQVPSMEASYPAYFTASSRKPHSTTQASGGNFGSNHTQSSRRRGRGSSITTTTAYPPTNPMMDSLSTTSISHGQGAPLSSTRVHAHYSSSQQQKCLACSGHPHVEVEVHPPSHASSNADSTSGPLQHGSECYGQEVPTIGHRILLTHNATHIGTGTDQQQLQTRPPRSEPEVLVDQISTSTTRTTKPTTPPPSVRQHWLSLPSATPEQCSSPSDKTKREGNSSRKEDGIVGGSCREISTQTLYVESVATQTDLDGKEHDNPPTSPVIVGQTNVSSCYSPPTLTKGSVDSTAVSMGDLHTTAPSKSEIPQANPKLSIIEHTTPRPAQGISDSHKVPRDFNSDDVLLNELLTASILLNGQGAYIGGGQTDSQGSTSTSKEAELLE